MRFTKLAALLAIAAGLTGPALAEVSELRITRQPSTVYLPLILMEQQKLVEKKTREAGLGDVKVSWLTFSSGGASTDALMSGNVDLVTSGVSNLLLLWDRTRGEVKGVAGASAVPMVLVTRNPAVKTLADFSEKDRIAVPTVKVSMQAIVLQIAAEKAFGEAGRNKLDAITIQLGHPDAAIALANPRSEVNSHFSLPPFLNFELADPNIHKVVNSSDVMGGPVSNGVIFGTRKFQEANPKLMAAFRAALDEAMSLIKNDPRQAAEIYLAATREKISVDELAKIIGDKESVFSAAPQNTMKIADHLHKSGVIKRAAETWKDFFFADVHALQGS